MIVKPREGEKVIEHIFKSLCSVNERDSLEQAQFLNLHCTSESPGESTTPMHGIHLRDLYSVSLACSLSTGGFKRFLMTPMYGQSWKNHYSIGITLSLFWFNRGRKPQRCWRCGFLQREHTFQYGKKSRISTPEEGFEARGKAGRWRALQPFPPFHLPLGVSFFQYYYCYYQS